MFRPLQGHRQEGIIQMYTFTASFDRICSTGMLFINLPDDDSVDVETHSMNISDKRLFIIE
jgi:hypothetical protein